MIIGMNFRKTYKSLRPAFTSDLWKIDLDTVSSAKRRFFRFMKLSRFTITEFAEQRMGFQCVALSYFGLLAVIPMLAFIFYVTDGLGATEWLNEFMRKNLSFHLDADLIEMLESKAKLIIETASSGIVGIISALMFLWTIFWMMFQTERVFNNIWGMRKIGRKIYKRFSTYLITLILIPFVVLIFGAGIALYSDLFGFLELDFQGLNFIKTLISWLLFTTVAVFVISAMFKYIPAVRVEYRYALRSALFTGIVFSCFQYLYLETQIFVSRFNAVYGVLAAVPLFMIWLNFSWQIIMYGCMLCRAFHNADSYNLDE